MFIDASVIVAILLKEDGHADLIERIEAASLRRSSVLALFEAVPAVSRTFGVEGACSAVEQFVDAMGIDILAVDPTLLRPLVETHGRYGKGTGHPARLNMGDATPTRSPGGAACPFFTKAKTSPARTSPDR